MKLHLTGGTNEFVFDCKSTETVDDVTRDIALAHNLRDRVKRLAAGARELAKYGPMREEKDRGLTQAQIAGTASLKSGGADPLGLRVGTAPADAAAATLNRCADDLDALIDPNLTKRRRAVDVEGIHQALENMKGAVMIAYPMGLPVWDTVQMGLDDEEELAGSEASKHVMDPDACTLWFAGKLMERSVAKAYQVSKYCGKNEKCIVKVKLQHKGSQAPQREPVIDDESRKKMYAYWHKKQNIEKELAADDENSYLNSSWANPKSMKNSLNGFSGNVRWR